MSLVEPTFGLTPDFYLCQEAETGPGKRQRKAKVFDSYEDPHRKGTKKKKMIKKGVKSKELAKKEKEKEKEKDSKGKGGRAKERRRIVFVPTLLDTKVLPSVALSHINKAAQLTLSEDQMTCFGCEVLPYIIFMRCS